METGKTSKFKSQISLIAVLLMSAIIIPSQMMGSTPKRLFGALASMSDITLVYISEAAFQSGFKVPSDESIVLSLNGSSLTGFEMAKAQFDGKEKKAIVKLANDIIEHNNFELLTEIQKGFEGGFTRVYIIPIADKPGYASQVFIYSNRGSFGATVISITGNLYLRHLFAESLPFVRISSYYDLIGNKV